MKKRLSCLLTLCAASHLLSAQQEHPNRASGLRSESLYTSGREDINIFNGNLSYTVTIGDPIPVGPSLQLALQLTYNSKTWTYWNFETFIPCPGAPTGVSSLHADGDRTLGLGWQAHFGRLVILPSSRTVLQFCPPGTPPPPPYRPGMPTGDALSMWNVEVGFQGPDGSIHEFYDRLDEAPPLGTDPVRKCWSSTWRAQHPGPCYVYTHDGSFLRMDPMDQTYGGGQVPVVYFPDGTIYVMGLEGGRHAKGDLAYPNVLERDREFASLSFYTYDGYTKTRHVTTIRDRHGNAIKITYYGDGDPISPPHPLAQLEPEQNRRDMIPYRAFPVGREDQYIEFEVGTRQITSWNTTEWMPYITRITVPDPNGGTTRPAYLPSSSLRTLTGQVNPLWTQAYQAPVLDGLALPEGISYSFGYGGSGTPDYGEGTALLTQLRVPTNGVINYGYGFSDRYSWAPERCVPSESPCEDPYHADGVVVLTSKTEKRAVKPSEAGTAIQETSLTQYVSSYRGVCSVNATQNCILRVDVWNPVAASSSGGNVAVTRSVFAALTGVQDTLVQNRPLYGKPIQTCEYFISPGAPRTGSTFDGAGSYDANGMGMCDSSGYRPYKDTRLEYDFDGYKNANGVSEAHYYNHNTREKKRTILWRDTSNSAEQARLEMINTPGAGPWRGHWAKTETIETRAGLTQTLRVEEMTHKENTTTWIIDPVVQRIINRPRVSSLDRDIATTNLSTTETFTVDDTTGFVSQRQVTADDGRVHTTTWTKGTSGGSTWCLAGGVETSPECSNLGFPTSVTQQLGSSTYTRYNFYRNGVLSAAYDGGTTFYAIDRDVNRSGHITADRPSEGRTSLSDTAPALRTALTYDGLGRAVLRRTYGAPGQPAQGGIRTAHGAQYITTYRCPSSNPESCTPADALESSRTVFDELGRPTAEIRRMPFDTGNTHSYRYRIYDVGGRRIADSEWLPRTCSTSSVTPCDEVLNVQPAVSATTIWSGLAYLPGKISWNFDGLGRAANVRQVSASPSTVEEASRSFTGWWQDVVSRPFNVGGSCPSGPYCSSTTFIRDGLGRIASVTEPATTNAGGGAMNPAETTTYRYDHESRLIRVQKTASGATQERWWKYDDFGWLLEEHTPEVPAVSYLTRDALGNPTRMVRGADDISKTYDGGGRLLTSTAYGALYPYETFDYDDVPPAYPYINLGRSNGRLIMARRTDHAITNNQAPAPVDFGYFDTIDLFHYLGPQGQLAFRQRWAYILQDYAQPTLRETLGAKQPPKVRTNLIRFFESQGRKHKSAKEAVLAGAIRFPGSPGSRVLGDGGREALGNPDLPEGWFNWWYEYDSDGRLKKIRYPRRDEGDSNRSTVEYTYSHGLLTKADAWLLDPYAAWFPIHAIGKIGYNPTGTPAKTEILWDQDGNPLTNDLRTMLVETPDQAGRPRVGAWTVKRSPSDILVEADTLSYDGSGNVTDLGSGEGFLYDSRGRLLRDGTKRSQDGSAFKEFIYDGFGNLNSYGGVTLYPSSADNRLTGNFSWDAGRGYLLRDGARSMEYDWYPDGRQMSAYKADAQHYVEPGPGISIKLLDSNKDVSLTFWGDNQFCDTSLFRHPLRDETGRVLADYKAEPFAACDCSEENGCAWVVKWEKDYVWMGPYALVARPKGTATTVAARDYLGTTRHEFDMAGSWTGQTRLEAFGTEIAAFSGERHRFTGHEREHATGDPSSQLAMQDNMHARQYSPVVGRFLSPDELGGTPRSGESWNRYTYAGDNPVNFFDPDGEKSSNAIRRAAIDTAWAQERALVIRTGQGTRAWTAAEEQQLLSTGKVSGYDGHHINSVNGSPHLAGDPNNIEFLTPGEHYVRHHNGRYRIPTYGPLLARANAVLQVAQILMDAWTQYKIGKEVGIVTSQSLFGYGELIIVDVKAAARSLDGQYIQVDGEILQARDGEFFRAGCDTSKEDCKVSGARLQGSSFTSVRVD